MDAFPRLPTDRRRILCEQASAELGLTAGSIEKDFWVCWTLRELFRLPDVGAHLTFKGGTSLSKGWRLIKRFSEDIDVVIDRDLLGIDGHLRPEGAAGSKERRRRLDALSDRCRQLIRERLLPAFGVAVRAAVPEGSDWRVELAETDPDAQTILFTYPASLLTGQYVGPVVKIELGARSDIDPNESPSITPYVAEALPAEFVDATFEVRTVAPERTFWEKLCLLHEEQHRAGVHFPKPGLARHYYDLFCLIEAGVGNRAIAEVGLFARVVEHRKVFFSRVAAQATLQCGSLAVLPADDRRARWTQDYEKMREAMFFEEPPPFDEILSVVGDFVQRFNEGAGA